MLKLWVVALVSLKLTLGNKLDPVISTPFGELEGHIQLSVYHNPYFAFEGVPYAKAPEGDLRFEEPSPPEPWIGIWKAKQRTQCIQYNHFNQDHDNNYVVEGDENCLFLNIYTHSLSPSANLDVMVHIHGGAFMFGSGSSYGPEIIMDRPIVYVNFNYRLGPLGFLSTEDEIIPGNNGLKDQSMALKWVKENIKYFGGNPESITISGLSAGGASVHLHYFMPASRGLFKGGISQSGCALNPWVLAENPRVKAKKLAHDVGCSAETSQKMLECLKTRPARQIVSAVKEFQPWLYNPFSPFGVVIDKWSKNPALPEHPYILLKKGRVQDVPWMISYTTSEGLYPASDFYSNGEHLKDLDTKWNEIIPFVLHFNCSVKSGLRDEVSDKIRKYYFDGKPVNKKTFSKLVELVSDRLFIVDIEKAARLHSSAVKSNIYSYYFDYRGASSKSDARTLSKVDLGVSHGDDTMYILRGATDFLTTQRDKQMSQILSDMFVSFMQTGKPNITSEWPPLKKSVTDPYVLLKISNPGDITVEQKDQLGPKDFWDSLPLLENHHLLSSKDEL